MVGHAEVFDKKTMQCRAATGVVGVAQEVFEIDREKLARRGEFVCVRRAIAQAIARVAQAQATRLDLPPSQIEQMRDLRELQAAARPSQPVSHSIHGVSQQPQ